MPFFDNLAKRIGGYTLQLTISKQGDELVVMVYPQISDKAEIQDKITPLSIKGTSEELDQSFFASLGVTLDKTKEFATQIKVFEKNLEKATEKASGKKSTTDKAVETTKPPKKEDTKPSLFDKKVEEKAKEKAPDNVDKDTGEIKPGSPEGYIEPKKREKITAASTAVEPEPESEPAKSTVTDTDGAGSEDGKIDNENW